MEQLALPGFESLVAPDPADLTACRRVLAALLWYARGSPARECFPRQRTIAERLGYSVRTVGRAIAALLRAGILARVRRARSALYRIIQVPLWVSRDRPGIPDRAPPAPQNVRSLVRSVAPAPTCIEEGVKKTNGRDGVSGRARIPSLARSDLADPFRMRGILEAVGLATDRPGLAQDPRTLLRWFGLARRALRVGRNPGGLFRALVRRRAWSWISQDDEDRARADLAASVHGTALRRRAPARDAVAEALGEFDE